MGNLNNQRQTTVIIQVVVLSFICIGLVGMGFVFGFFKAPKDSRNLTMRLESTAGSIQMTYSIPGDEKKTAQTTSAPWEKTIGMKVGSEVYLSAGNPNQMGNVTCTLLLDGKVWKTQSAKYPVDKVSCAGIVP